MRVRLEKKSFDFGQNWRAFASQALNSDSADAARRDFLDLMDGIELADRRFIDVGFGQGLSMLCAAE